MADDKNRESSPSGELDPSATFVPVVTSHQRPSTRPPAQFGLAARADDSGPTQTATPAQENLAPDTSALYKRMDANERRTATFVGRAQLSRLPPIAVFGKYDLLGRLTYGGMAEIFLARERDVSGSQRFVVLKRILPHIAADKSFVSMFMDEARIASQLNHPHLCAIYAVGEEHGAVFIAMEWVYGATLSKLVRRLKKNGRKLDIPLALKIGSQVAEALESAHRAVDSHGEPLGIVHRDVSPQNIMISFDGVVKLLDFGIAKAASQSQRTEAGVIKGKYSYMSPEQCLGEPIDARSDLFALGICMFESIVGDNPFKRSTEYDTMRAIVLDAPELPAEIPSGLRPFFEKALAKRREERFQSAGEMHEEVERMLIRLSSPVSSMLLSENMNAVFADDIRLGPRLDTQVTQSVSPTAGLLVRGSSSGPSSEPSRSVPYLGEALTPVGVGQQNTVPNAALASGPPPATDRWSRWRWIFVALLLIGIGAASSIVYRLSQNETAGTIDADQHSNNSSNEETPNIENDEPQTTQVSVQITSTPSASVSIDGQAAVSLPLDVQLASGGHTLAIDLEGYEPWRQTVQVTDTPITLHADLTPVRRRVRDNEPDRATETEDQPIAMGQISLNTRPWSRVYLGARLLGTTPFGNVEVPAGTHTLRFVDRDGHEHIRQVTVEANGSIRRSFNFEDEPDTQVQGPPQQVPTNP